MTYDIHPVTGSAPGTVPDTPPPPHRRGPRPGRWRRIAVGAAVGISVVAGGVAVVQLPLRQSQVGPVVTATQNPDDGAAQPQQAPVRAHAGGEQGHEDD